MGKTTASVVGIWSKNRFWLGGKRPRSGWAVKIRDLWSSRGDGKGLRKNGAHTKNGRFSKQGLGGGGGKLGVAGKKSKRGRKEEGGTKNRKVKKKAKKLKRCFLKLGGKLGAA